MHDPTRAASFYRNKAIQWLDGVKQRVPGLSRHFWRNRAAKVCLEALPQAAPDLLVGGLKRTDDYISHSAASPRKAKKPTTSVTVVTNTPEAIAGSIS